MKTYTARTYESNNPSSHQIWLYVYFLGVEHFFWGCRFYKKNGTIFR